MKRILLTMVPLLLLPMVTLAATTAVGVTITNLQINKASGTFVFIQVSGTRTGNPPDCHNSSWHYTLSLTNPGDRELYGMLLMAYSTSASVNIAGTNSCNEAGFVESLQSLQLTQ